MKLDAQRNYDVRQRQAAYESKQIRERERQIADIGIEERQKLKRNSGEHKRIDDSECRKDSLAWQNHSSGVE
jgi:hypothetical protein